MIAVEGEDISGNSFFDVFDSLFLCFALTDASRKAWAFGDIEAVFARIYDNLSHINNPFKNIEKREKIKPEI